MIGEYPLEVFAVLWAPAPAPPLLRGPCGPLLRGWVGTTEAVPEACKNCDLRPQKKLGGADLANQIKSAMDRRMFD